jgi:hypothetical protein
MYGNDNRRDTAIAKDFFQGGSVNRFPPFPLRLGDTIFGAVSLYGLNTQS